MWEGRIGASTAGRARAGAGTRCVAMGSSSNNREQQWRAKQQRWLSSAAATAANRGQRGGTDGRGRRARRHTAALPNAGMGAGRRHLAGARADTASTRPRRNGDGTEGVRGKWEWRSREGRRRTQPAWQRSSGEVDWARGGGGRRRGRRVDPVALLRCCSIQRAKAT